MGAHIQYIEFITTREPKTFRFDLPKDVDSDLVNEIDPIIRHNEILGEHTIKNEVRQLFSKYKHGNDTHDHGKQKNE